MWTLVVIGASLVVVLCGTALRVDVLWDTSIETAAKCELLEKRVQELEARLKNSVLR